MEERYNSVWDVLYDNPDESGDLKKRSGYMILIQARLFGLRDEELDESECCGLPIDQVRDLMEGKIGKFSLPELMAIARKIGINTKV